jgi:hypothetical protein
VDVDNVIVILLVLPTIHLNRLPPPRENLREAKRAVSVSSLSSTGTLSLLTKQINPSIPQAPAADQSNRVIQTKEKLP